MPIPDHDPHSRRRWIPRRLRPSGGVRQPLRRDLRRRRVSLRLQAGGAPHRRLRGPHRAIGALLQAPLAAGPDHGIRAQPRHLRVARTQRRQQRAGRRGTRQRGDHRIGRCDLVLRPARPAVLALGRRGPVVRPRALPGDHGPLPCDSRRTSAGPWTSSSSISKGSKPPCSARRTPPGDWHVSDALSHAAMNSVPENQRSAGRGCRIFESLSAAFHRESESTQVGIASAYQGLTI